MFWNRAIGFTVCVCAAAVALPACEKKSAPTEKQPTAALSGVLPVGADKPNIIIVLVDALRADRLGPYGHAGRLSPTMDALAAEGVTFQNCIAPAPWTLPSVASMFVSYHPSVHHATSYRATSSKNPKVRAAQAVLNDKFVTLAEALQAAGYQTAAFSASCLIRGTFGFDQGFEHFDGQHCGKSTPVHVVSDAALKWLRSERDTAKPFFVYLHYMDVHGPYDAPPRFMAPLMERVEQMQNRETLSEESYHRINRYLRKPPAEASDPTRFERLKQYREYWVARYEAGVAQMDFYLDELFAQLRELGLWDDAYIILLADHGEALGEHTLWDHGYSLHQTDLHVPLILRWPGILPGGVQVTRRASLMDVFPTVLSQLHLPPKHNVQGRSLVGSWLNDGSAGDVVYFAESVKFGPTQWALFRDPFKLIVTQIPRRTGRQNTIEDRLALFNLHDDPHEGRDLARTSASVVAELRELLDRTVNDNRIVVPQILPQTAPVAPEMIEVLRSLGYVGDTGSESGIQPDDE